MRGVDISLQALCITRTVEDFVRTNHPLRALCKLIDGALRDLSAHFNRLYADAGSESVAPERLIRGSLLQEHYSVRCERQRVEQIRYNLMYRRFAGLETDDWVWRYATFTLTVFNLLRFGHLCRSRQVKQAKSGSTCQFDQKRIAIRGE